MLDLILNTPDLLLVAFVAIGYTFFDLDVELWVPEWLKRGVPDL